MFWVVVATAAALVLLRLGTARLFDPDEARFARTTVEMMQRGDLVVPIFEGVPRTVKPPLLHWCQAAFFRIFGRSELGARLPAALATLGSLLLVAWVARRRFGEEGAAWAAIIFATLPMVVIEGRVGTTDALLSVHIFAALALDMAETGETRRNRAGAIGALLGLAFLAKGPVGVILPLLMILAGRTAAGKNIVPERRSVLAFVAAWCVVALPWSLAFVERLSATTAFGTLRTEVLERYFAGTQHPEPPWYFAPVLLVGFFPWVAPMSLALVRVLGRRRDPAARTGLYAGAALLAGVLFFSIGKGKLPQYILPLAPLVAILVTWELGQEIGAVRERRMGPLLLTGSLMVGAIVFGAAATLYSQPAARQVGAVGAVAHGLAALVALWGLLSQRPRLVYGAAAAAMALFLLAAGAVLQPAIAHERSTGYLPDSVPALMDTRRPIVLVGAQRPSLTYYLDRVPERVVPEDLGARLDEPDDPLFVIRSRDLDRLPAAVRDRLREVGHAGEFAVFAKIAPPAPAAAGDSENATNRPGDSLDGRRARWLG